MGEFKLHLGMPPAITLPYEAGTNAAETVGRMHIQVKAGPEKPANLREPQLK